MSTLSKNGWKKRKLAVLTNFWLNWHIFDLIWCFNQKQFTFKPSISSSKPQYSPNRIEKYIKSDNGPEPVLMSRFHGQRNLNFARQNTLQDGAAPFRYEQKNKTNGKKPNQPQQTKPRGEGHDQSSPRSVDSMDQPTDTNYNY